MRLCAAVLFVGLLSFTTGCPPEDYANRAPATLADINLILNNEDLTAQQKRIRLEDLGLDAVTVNVLLIEERTANQFGGDLRSAYDKVVEPDFRKLTPDEIQIYGDGASTADEDVALTLADDEALAMAQFFDDEDIATPEELREFLDDSTNEVPDEIPDGSLRTLFIDFDPSLLLPDLP